MLKAEKARRGLEEKHAEWLNAWKAAMSEFHLSENKSMDEVEASLAAWDEFPQLLKEQHACQRRIEGIERDMRTFKARVDDLFKTLGRELPEHMSKDAAVRLLNKELKVAQASDAALAQLKSQLDSCIARKHLVASQSKRARAAFDLFCTELPRSLPPVTQIEMIEERQEVRERVRQRRESLATLAQGEKEENLRGRLEIFAEDEGRWGRKRCFPSHTAAQQTCESQKDPELLVYPCPAGEGGWHLGHRRTNPATASQPATTAQRREPLHLVDVNATPMLSNLLHKETLMKMQASLANTVLIALYSTALLCNCAGVGVHFTHALPTALRCCVAGGILMAAHDLATGFWFFWLTAKWVRSMQIHRDSRS